MEEEIMNEIVEGTEIPSDKFDRHMRKARKDDINARRRMLQHQAEKDADQTFRVLIWQITLPLMGHTRIRIAPELYDKLVKLGILDYDVRSKNRGASNYAEHVIQPWAIWMDWNLNPWDADIVKRVLQTKAGDSRRLDYEKIIHICQERIRQIDCEQEIINPNNT